MKVKLTLTIDRDTIVRAKTFAKKENTSISELVERQLDRLGSESFVEKWGGKFKVPDPVPADPRLNYLLTKYVQR
jgi:hypothetical protein